MKKPLIYSALLATSVVGLISCDDSKNTSAQPAQPQQTAAADAEQVAEPNPAEQPPSVEEVTELFTQKLSHLAFIKLDKVELESTPRGNGGHQLTAKVTISVSENLYTKQQSPDEFKEGRKVV